MMTRGHRDPRQTFSGSADRYLISTDHQTGPDLKLIREVAAQRFPDVTADVATGAGHALRAACPFSGFCVALDLTREMLVTARRYLSDSGFERVQFVQSAAHRLPLADSSVSLLTCRIAPHHFQSIPDFLGEVRRVLKEDGRSVIIDSVVPDDQTCDVFINEVEQIRDPSHIRSHNLRQWMDYIEEADLELISQKLFERTHPFREWVSRTGLDEPGKLAVEKIFLEAQASVRERFKIRIDGQKRVLSYSDEKGIFVVKIPSNRYP